MPRLKNETQNQELKQSCRFYCCVIKKEAELKSFQLMKYMKTSISLVWILKASAVSVQTD